MNIDKGKIPPLQHWLIFTDLDGTLLNHHDYSYAAAQPALDQLAQYDIPVILNSSKTLDEIRHLANDLKLTSPQIAENGSVIYDPIQQTTLNLGDDYQRICHKLKALRQQHSWQFSGFNDWSAADIAEITGLSLAAAARAKQRQGSEPILWEDSEENLQKFITTIHSLQLELKRGGRFYHVMGQTDKVKAMQHLTHQHEAQRQHSAFTIALGDSANDKDMLAVADVAVIVKNPNAAKFQLESSSPSQILIKTSKTGAEGWHQAISTLLNAMQPLNLTHSDSEKEIMSDFKQSGLITTLHRLPNASLEKIENELREFSKRRPMTLILPSLFSELEGEALPRILDELKHADYINEIVIGLDRANAEEFAYARDFFSVLPQKKRILWNDGPRLREIDQLLEKKGLAPEQEGKGRNVWYCMGYIQAANQSKAIALHDCDILTYSREIPARLFYPIANPALDFEFCKGYYARISSEGYLSGRVTRLFVQPMLVSLKQVLGSNNYLEFMNEFRFPLAGEFAMNSNMLSSMRIPSDWGLEIGILSEVYRNTSTRRVCQVDIADNYDHKHQDMGEQNHNDGLSKMSYEIAKTIFRRLGTEGFAMNNAFFRAVRASYLRTALDMLDSYDADAHLNGLNLDIHAEEQSIELFASGIIEAGKIYQKKPLETPFIPNWRRVFSAIPELPTQLLEAVEQDNVVL